MERPQIIVIGKKRYYDANELKDYDSTYFYGCAPSVRTIISKKNIDTKHISYATNNKKYGWRFSSDQKNPSKKSRLLLSENWVLENIPKMMENAEEDEDEDDDINNDENESDDINIDYDSIDYESDYIDEPIESCEYIDFTSEEIDLISAILDISKITIHNLINDGPGTHCVYRFSLGICKDLRKIMKIPKAISDDFIIIKYGCTDNLIRQTAENNKVYGSIKNVNLKLLNYAYIDPRYLSQADNEIEEYFSNIEKPIMYEKFSELVAINPKHEKQIITQYGYIAKRYAGCVKELLNNIETLKREIISEKHKNESIITTHLLELTNKDKDIENMKKIHILELQNKDLMLAQINAELQNKKLELENKDLKLKLMCKIK